MSKEMIEIQKKKKTMISRRIVMTANKKINRLGIKL